MRSEETGQPKGCGFISVNDYDGAKRDVQALNGRTIGDRTISVNFAGQSRIKDETWKADVLNP